MMNEPIQRPGCFTPGRKGGVKMKRLLVFIVLIAIAAPAMAADVEGDGTDDIMPYVILFPGDYYSASSTLYTFWPLDRDNWFFVTVGDGLLTVTMEDCCTMGDTIYAYLHWYYHGFVDWGYAISPETVTLQANTPYMYSLFRVQTGYWHKIGTYPAGYYIDASFD